MGAQQAPLHGVARRHAVERHGAVDGLGGVRVAAGAGRVDGRGEDTGIRQHLAGAHLLEALAEQPRVLRNVLRRPRDGLEEPREEGGRRAAAEGGHLVEQAEAALRLAALAAVVRQRLVALRVGRHAGADQLGPHVPRAGRPERQAPLPLPRQQQQDRVECLRALQRRRHALAHAAERGPRAADVPGRAEGAHVRAVQRAVRPDAARGGRVEDAVGEVRVPAGDAGAEQRGEADGIRADARLDHVLPEHRVRRGEVAPRAQRVEQDVVGLDGAAQAPPGDGLPHVVRVDREPQCPLRHLLRLRRHNLLHHLVELRLEGLALKHPRERVAVVGNDGASARRAGNVAIRAGPAAALGPPPAGRQVRGREGGALRGGVRRRRPRHGLPPLQLGLEGTCSALALQGSARGVQRAQPRAGAAPARAQRCRGRPSHLRRPRSSAFRRPAAVSERSLRSSASCGPENPRSGFKKHKANIIFIVL